MPARPSVVVTGAAGLIGTVVCERLTGRYEIAGVDRVQPRDGRKVRKADLTRAATARKALVGADVVIDLAGDPHTSASRDVIFENNVASALNVLDAARDVGARRVILASSNQVVVGYEREAPYADIVAGNYERVTPDEFPRLTADIEPRPESFYGIGKVVVEQVARMYAQQQGLSVICLRIGTVNRADRPKEARHYATLLTHRDLGQLFERCVDAPAEVGYARYYGVSDNLWRFWDIEDARTAIGYEPVDDAETFRE